MHNHTIWHGVTDLVEVMMHPCYSFTGFGLVDSWTGESFYKEATLNKRLSDFIESGFTFKSSTASQIGKQTLFPQTKKKLSMSDFEVLLCK